MNSWNIVFFSRGHLDSHLERNLQRTYNLEQRYPEPEVYSVLAQGLEEVSDLGLA